MKIKAKYENLQAGRTLYILDKGDSLLGFTIGNLASFTLKGSMYEIAEADRTHSKVMKRVEWEAKAIQEELNSLDADSCVLERVFAGSTPTWKRG